MDMRKFLTLGIGSLFILFGFNALGVVAGAAGASGGFSAGLFSTSTSDYEIITYQDAGTILQQRLIMKTNPNFALPNPQSAKFILINRTQCEIPAAPTPQQIFLCQQILPRIPCVYIHEDHVLSCRVYYDAGDLGEKGKLLEENDIFYVQVKVVENGAERVLTQSPDFQFSSRRLTILTPEELPEDPSGTASSSSSESPSGTNSRGTDNRFAARTRVPVPAVSSGGSSSDGCMHLAGAVTSSRGLWEIVCGPWTLIFLFLILIRLSLPSRKRRPGKSFSRSGR